MLLDLRLRSVINGADPASLTDAIRAADTTVAQSPDDPTPLRADIAGLLAANQRTLSTVLVGQDARMLLELSGATDPDVIRPPAVSAFTTKGLGTGLRTMRHKEADGTVVAMLGFAFRSAEFETDVQVTAGTPDLRQLQKATRDIEDFIHGMSVHYNPEPPS